MSKPITPYHYYDLLFAWYDGADPYGNEQGALPAQGESISKWYDKGQNRLHFTATSGNEPTYDLANKRMLFDGSQHMTVSGIDNFPSKSTFNGTAYIFIVGALDYVADSQTDVLISGKSTDGTGDWTFATEYFDSDDSTLRVFPSLKYKKASDNSNVTVAAGDTNGDGVPDNPAAEDVGDNVDAIFETFFGDYTGAFTTANNGTIGVNATDAGNWYNDIVLQLMKNNQGSVQETKGHIYEVLILTTALNQVNRNALQGYFKHKYGLGDHVLKAGVDQANEARPFHPFLSNQPQTNDSVISVVDTGATSNIPDLYTGMHKRNPRKPLTFVRLTLDENTLNSSDGFEARGGKKLYYFSEEANSPLTRYVQKSYPNLISVSPAPVEIVPTKGVSLRGTITIKLRDFVDAGETSSYFSKFLAQNPFYFGRRIEIFESFTGGLYSYMGETLNFIDGRKEYQIDSIHLNQGVLTIKAKDPLTLGDSLKSKVPKPSRFSLNADITNTETGNLSVRLDGTTLTESPTNTYTDSNFALFEETFGAHDAEGFMRINEEIIKYKVIKTGSIGSSPNCQLNILTRPEWGTKVDEHSADDTIQQCVVFGDYTTTSSGKFIDEVAYELLVNQAGVSPNAIETGVSKIYSWTDERETWVNTFKINAILSEPKEVNKTLAQFANNTGVNFFWDDNAGKIRMKAETPLLDTSSIVTVTDDHILLNSFNLINSEKDRVSRVYYYYGIKDSTADRDKPKNFKNLYVTIDSDSEGEAQYGIESNKVIYGWGIRDTSTATTMGQRLLSRYKNTPITCTFEVDKSVDDIRTGDHFFLNTRHILNSDGTIRPQTEMQCVSLTYDSKKQINKIKAISFNFSGANLGKITANIDTVNAAGSGYSAGDTLTQASVTPTGGTGMTVTVNTVSGGAVATYTVTDYGQNYNVGDVVTFNGGNSDFKLNINRGSFAREGTGLGNTASPYTGNRLINSYISCDSVIPSANGGAESRQFIEVVLSDAGSGYATGTHAFTGTEITGNSTGTGLALSVVVNGSGNVTAITVTNNPVTGSEPTEASPKGYTYGEILTLNGHSGNNARFIIQPSAKMSTGGEPYMVV